MARWARFPDLHIYHYAPYEPAALKRLMGRYATREEEMDRMLRGEAVRRSVPSRSPQPARERRKLLDQAAGAASMGSTRTRSARRECRARAISRPASSSMTSPSIAEETKATVRAYNKDDCRSAVGLARLARSAARTSSCGAGPKCPARNLATARRTKSHRLADQDQRANRKADGGRSRRSRRTD